MLCPLKYSYILGVLSQRRLGNHKRPLIKKQRGKDLPKLRRKMSLFCIGTCHRAEAETADKYTEVVKLQTYYAAFYRKDHKFTQQVSNTARNTWQVFWFSALGTIQHWLFHAALPFFFFFFAEDGSTRIAHGKKDVLFPSCMHCKMWLNFISSYKLTTASMQSSGYFQILLAALKVKFKI